MKLLLLEAVRFGKLENFTLEPKEGLNTYRHPNEYGKTTLIFFIYYMLYGYDARLLKSYLPWSGAEPEGRLRFEQEGLIWEIQRRRPARGAEKRTVFCLTTGQELALSAREQPGAHFLGLDGETFLRSFCITQGDLLFSRTNGLDIALKNMSATGDENVSFKLAEDFLNKQHTKYMYRNKNQGPLLERKEALAAARSQYRELSDRLERQLELRRQWEALEQALPAAEEQLQSLSALLKKAEASDAQKLLSRLDALRQEPPAPPKISKEKLEEWEQAFALRQEAEAARKDAEEERERLSDRLRLVSESAEQFGFHALSGRDLERLEKGSGGAIAAGILLLLLSAAGLAAGIFYNPVFYAAAAAGLCGGLLLLLLPSAARRRICHAYGAATPRQLSEKWARYQEVLARREECRAELETASAAAEERKAADQAAEARLEALRRETRLLTPEEVRRQRVEWGVYEAALAQNTAALQEQALLNGRSRAELEALAAGAETVEESAEQIRRRLSRAEEEYRALLARRIDLNPRELERLWEEQAALAEQIKEEEEAIRAGEEELAAVQKSLAWLKEANEEMNARFAPRLCTLAGEILARLTDGKYQTLWLDAQYGITLKTPEGAYPVTAFSAGTRDAVYFSFRMAVSSLLSDTPLPMVLDDPFSNLDAQRRAEAEKLLESAGAERQILYFTCRT